jgi:hypothetical protein
VRPQVSLGLTLVFVASCQLQSCPSTAGGACDPRNANCPKGYACAVAEICTHPCEQPSDCWVKVSDGCRSNDLPGQKLPDGGFFTETSEDGFCTETKVMVCADGYCQREACADGGCDYDVYGPSPFKGNRSQGPTQ